MEHSNWEQSWQGGFCPLAAVGGLPVRDAEYRASSPLAEVLAQIPKTQPGHICPARLYSAWSNWLGDMPIAFTASVSQAREGLMRAAGVDPAACVGIPANATNALVESVKRLGAQPIFHELDADLALELSGFGTTHVHATWSQPVGGLWNPRSSWNGIRLCDFSDTLPLQGGGRRFHGNAAIWGLHLGADPQNSGALVAFNDDSLCCAFNRLTDWELPNLEQAWAQFERLTELADRQEPALGETRRGLSDAAGLPLLPRNSVSLAHGIAVKIPYDSDPSTFYAYVRAENTPVRWLPEVRPVHYAAWRQGSRHTAEHLARWLLVPVGPYFSSEEVKHAVLGIVKASEYLGIRWYTNPERATAYALTMQEMYGEKHDGYRPLFHVPTEKRS